MINSIEKDGKMLMRDGKYHRVVIIPRDVFETVSDYIDETDTPPPISRMNR